MIAIEAHGDDCVLPVRAQPAAKANQIRGIQDGSLKVCVTQIPEKGKANHAIREVICKSLKLRRSQVRLLSGESSPVKRFLIVGISQAELIQRITDCLPPPE